MFGGLDALPGATRGENVRFSCAQRCNLIVRSEQSKYPRERSSVEQMFMLIWKRMKGILKVELERKKESQFNS